MIRRHGRIAATLAAGLFFGAGLSSCATTSLEQREWLRVETPHFEIRSALGQQATIRLARDLETFVLAGEALLGATLELPTRFRVYAHDGKGFERPFERGNDVAWFRSSAAGGLLVLRGGEGFTDAKAPTRAALMRSLLHANGGLETPLWYDEGVTAFVSTARSGGRQIQLGVARFDLLEHLQDQIWPTTSQILSTYAVEDWGRRDRAVFRARSWALVHFVVLGELPDDAPRPVLDLARARDNADNPAPRPTPERWFGVAGGDFDQALRRYARQLPGKTGLVIRTTGPDSLSAPEALDCDTTADVLGWLALELERDGFARRYYRHALRCDRNSARAHAGMASAEALRGRFDATEALRKRALELAPDDPRVQLEAGRSYEWMARDAGGSERDGLLEAAREHFRRAAELAPQDPEARRRLASSLLADPNPTRAQAKEALATLERTQPMLPGALDLMLDRARAHAALNEPTPARYLARIVQARSDENDLRDAADELATSLEATGSESAGARR